MAVIKPFLQNLKAFFIAIISMGNCCRRNTSLGPISILLLGTGNSGKTEIGYSLSGQPRLDFGSTKGVHIYNMNSKCQHIRLTEIGGSDAVRDIWPHYYNDAFGIVFVIDCSLQAPFEMMRDILHKLMLNKHIRGKPLLIVANKQDLEQSIDVIDITYFFRVDELCNRLGTPCRIIASGEDERTDLHNGMEWLTDKIVENHKSLQNRIRFNDTFTSPAKQFKGDRKTILNKVTPLIHGRRVRSAPSKITQQNAAKMNGFLNTPVNASNCIQILAPATAVPPATPRPYKVQSSRFRLDTVVLRHE